MAVPHPCFPRLRKPVLQTVGAAVRGPKTIRLQKEQRFGTEIVSEFRARRRSVPELVLPSICCMAGSSGASRQCIAASRSPARAKARADRRAPRWPTIERNCVSIGSTRAVGYPIREPRSAAASLRRKGREARALRCRRRAPAPAPDAARNRCCSVPVKSGSIFCAVRRPQGIVPLGGSKKTLRTAS